MSTTWTPASWRDRPARQQPVWLDTAQYEATLKTISGYPPLVFAGEARALQADLARVAAGEAFLLQAGDCAESFHELSVIAVRERLKLLLQMSAVLTYGATLPVLLTVDEAADLLRTTRRAIYAMIERRQLPGVIRIRRRVLLRADDLLHWLDQKRAPSSEE